MRTERGLHRDLGAAAFRGLEADGLGPACGLWLRQPQPADTGPVPEGTFPRLLPRDSHGPSSEAVAVPSLSA